MQPQKLTIVNFGARFSELINRDGGSQKEIAARLGISEGAIVNYKRDRIPKAEELLAISAYFRVSMEYLLTGAGPAPPRGASESGNFSALKAETRKLLSQLEAVEATAARLRALF